MSTDTTGATTPARARAGLVRRARPRPAVARPRRHPVAGDGLGVHAPADAGGARAPGLRGVAGDLADARGAGRGAQRRGRAGVGTARLPAPGAAPARGRHHHRRAARRRGPGRLRRPARPARRGRLHRQRDRVLRVRRPARGARHQRAAGPRAGRERRRVPRGERVGERAGAGRVAAARGRRCHLGGGRDGAGSAGLHGRQPAVRRLPDQLDAARGTGPGSRRTTVRPGRRRPGPGPTGWSGVG